MSRAGVGDSQRPRRRAAGVTLVELLVVLVILAVLTGLAIPRFSAAGGAKAQSDSTERLVAMARREAIRSRVPVTLVLTVRDSARIITAHADGTVAADAQLHISPFDGRVAGAH